MGVAEAKAAIIANKTPTNNVTYPDKLFKITLNLN